MEVDSGAACEVDVCGGLILGLAARWMFVGVEFEGDCGMMRV